jgi:predicted DNA-binding transcriptional regulator AlpA
MIISKYKSARDAPTARRRDKNDRALNVRELAERFGMGVSTIRAKIASGVGPPVFGPPGSNRLRIWESDADAWFESNCSNSGAA